MSLGPCARLLLAGQGREPTVGPASPPVPAEKTRRGSPAALLAFCPPLGPPSLSGSGRAGCGWLLVLGMSELGAPEASLSLHKGDMGLEEKGTSPESHSQPGGPVGAGPLVSVASAHLWGISGTCFCLLFFRLTHSWHLGCRTSNRRFIAHFTCACLWLYCWESWAHTFPFL